MSDTTQADTTDAHTTYESVTDPKAIANCEGIEIRQRTHIHENRDHYQNHCEANAIGRAIVGVRETADRLLLLVNPAADHATLPNDTVAPDEDWATVGKHRVEEQAGIDVTLDSIERVRRVDHAVDGESTPRSTVQHVVFGASVSSSDATLDALCDEDSEIGWYDELPVGTNNHGSYSRNDIQLFLG